MAEKYTQFRFSLVNESEFKNNYFYEEKKILLEDWLPNSADMNEILFKQELEKYKQLLVKYKPKAVLVNSKDLHFVISPDVQTWMAESIFTTYPSIGMVKKAFVMSEDFFTQLSMEQHLEEDRTNAFKSAFFHSIEAALEWLNEK